MPPQCDTASLPSALVLTTSNVSLLHLPPPSTTSHRSYSFWTCLIASGSPSSYLSRPCQFNRSIPNKSRSPFASTQGTTSCGVEACLCARMGPTCSSSATVFSRDDCTAKSCQTYKGLRNSLAPSPRRRLSSHSLVQNDALPLVSARETAHS